MPKINVILLEWEGFQYAASLHLSMGCYHIRLIEHIINLCMIILPWANYCYKCLTMVVANLPDILQQKMNGLFHKFEIIHVHIDILFVLTKVDWINHVQKLELTINKLK